MEKKMQEENASMQSKTIGELLFQINTPENLEENHSIYVAGCQIGADEDFPGTDVLTDWYQRNARIFTNLYRITENRTGERILVIFGAGHAYILRDLVRSAPEFKLVEVNEFLNEGVSDAEALLQKHLKSVEDKDSLTLKSTINMGGRYLLILPDGSTMNTASDFYNMHVGWFKEPGWTMEMSILEFSQSGETAQSTVEAIYREADRDGKPYFHKMWITYVLERIGTQWMVTSDHASTKEKSD